MVELQPSKLNVVGSSPIARSKTQGDDMRLQRRTRRSRSRMSSGHEVSEQESDHIIHVSNNPDEHSHGGGPDKGVVCEDNRVYFYAPVIESTVLDLNRILRSLDIEMQSLGIRFGGISLPIELHIHSGGGDLFSGLAAVDTIRTVKTPIHTYVDGSAASAATLMSLAGDKRFIYKNSFMLIHQLSSMMVEGTHEEFKDEFENQQRLMNRIKQLYREKANLNEELLEDLLKHDLWLDADKCLEYGLVDNVL